MNPDGSYTRKKPGPNKKPLNAQVSLIKGAKPPERKNGTGRRHFDD
jgi:hypothetical protein